MKHIRKIGIFCVCLMMIGVLISGSVALASEEGEEKASGGWRTTYNEIMLWLNFGILAFVIIKFGRAPIMNFLRGRKDELAREIKQVEDEKEKVSAKISDTLNILNESEVRFAELKQKIVDQGEKRKQEIIEDARRQSQIMIEATRQKLDTRILQAKSRFKAELVDEAITLATEKLPGFMTEEDNQRFVENYISEI